MGRDPGGGGVSDVFLFDSRVERLRLLLFGDLVREDTPFCSSLAFDFYLEDGYAVVDEMVHVH